MKIWCSLFAGILLLALGPAWAGQACTPGVKSCDGFPRAEAPKSFKRSMAVKSTALNATPCTVSGTWSLPSGLADVDDIVFVVNQNMTGTMKHPFCSAPHTLTASVTSPGTFTMYAAYPADPVCTGISFNLTHASNCSTAEGVAYNDEHPGLAIPVVLDRKSVSGLVYDRVKIPANAKVLLPRTEKKLLTEVQLAVTILDQNSPVSGVTPVLQSNRPAADTILGPSAPTNSQGTTFATVQTRDQTTSSLISIVSPTTHGGFNSNIPWLPAEYEEPFRLTCYVLSVEASPEFQSSTRISAAGLPVGSPTYLKAFLEDTKMQGTGLGMDGKYLNYNPRTRRYTYETCPRTRSGQCAVDGETVAVDMNVVPLKSTINIAILGNRKAMDTGGAIDENRIDVWFGAERDECRLFGNRKMSMVRVLSQ